MSSSYIGSDVLGGAFNASSVPGFDVLKPASYFPNAESIVNGNGSTGSSSSTSSTPPTSSSTTTSSNGVDSYEKQYDNFETSVNQELLGSLGSGSSSDSIPLYSGGTSASSFASLQQTLAAIAPGVAQGLYGDGTGSNVSTYA